MTSITFISHWFDSIMGSNPRPRARETYVLPIWPPPPGMREIRMRQQNILLDSGALFGWPALNRSSVEDS